MNWHFKINSIRNKLLLCFLILLVPIVVVGIVSYNSALSVVSDMAKDSVVNMIERIDFETDRLMKDAQDFAQMMSRDSTIQQPLREPLPERIEDVYKQRLDYNYKLYFTNQYREEVRGFYVIGENGARFKSSMMTPKDIDFRSQGWYKEIIAENDAVWFEPHVDSFVATTVGEKFISVGAPIIDRFSGKKLGVVLVDVAASRFQNNYDSQLIRDGRILMLNGKNQILLDPDLGDNGMTSDVIVDILDRADLKDSGKTQIIHSGGSGYLVSHKTSRINGWKTIGVVPFVEISRDASAIALTIAFMIGISCIAAAFFAVKAANSISSPIKKMSDTMKQVQHGDLSVRAEQTGRDEVGDLAVTFNKMIKQINVLIREQGEDQTKLRKAEQRALQAQINPHFLYNTLDSISWMARAKNVEQIDETIEALTMLFRISLSRGKDLITLGEELKHAHSYLRIQQIRYSKKLSYSIDVPEELCRYMTVKMTLQPLVENAIYHGVKEKRDKGLISIDGYEEEDAVVLVVRDTGKGMTPEKVSALNRAIAEDKEEISKNPVDSYGVVNVQRRIQIYFGAEYGLHYESEYMCGTTVTVRLPKREEGEQTGA